MGLRILNTGRHLQGKAKSMRELITGSCTAQAFRREERGEKREERSGTPKKKG